MACIPTKYARPNFEMNRPSRRKPRSLFFRLSLRLSLLVVGTCSWSPPVLADLNPTGAFNPDESLEVVLEPSGDDELRPQTTYRASGPWGDLDYSITYLTIPDQYVENWTEPSEVVAWHFSGMTIEEVKGKVLGMTKQSVSVGSEGPEARFVTGELGVTLFPNETLVRMLTPEQRSELALVLRNDPRNRFHRNPIVIESGDPVSWYRAAMLPEDTVQLIASLCYDLGGTRVFSDVPFVLSTLESLALRRDFLRAMTRTRSLFLRLNLRDADDLNSIAEYWTAGQKRKDLLPILKSITETPEIEKVDIAHLLPPTPRMLLFTFPDFAWTVSGEVRDCHWTSTNFFRAPPGGGIRNPSVRGSLMFESLEPVAGVPRFGDVLVVYAKETGEILHSAVYIAADILFTKNGDSMFKPWVLMRYTDMLAHFNIKGPTATRLFKHKWDDRDRETGSVQRVDE